MMDVEQLEEWRAADALFDRWLDQAEPDREAWLAAQDMPDAVRRRVQQLVRAHERTGNALDSAAGDLAGRSLGDWTLESELGRGGMAVVYLARREQGMASQRAAVKVLTLAALGAGGRERFQREAGILARLGHPNITRLIDSGVADDGTCWLAMPLVEGERIDHWCQARGLDARAIVQLYLQVCAAVAYAHRNLVIHRDLKPSNVLVDTDGNVHLLDFGIGQFADVPAERTRTQWRALTPGYAAPEQLRGDPPTTAIDVYGLGALLHRLLTGRAPGTTTAGPSTTRPSLLVRSTADAYHRHYAPLKNDLDLVLLKALAEEPERRYESVEAFTLDLRRWLDGQPVLAEKPRLVYRARKFVARNKAGVGAAVLLVASLAGGVGATLWQASEAKREAANAVLQAQRATLVRDFLDRVFSSTTPSVGDVPTALDLLGEGARRARSEIVADDPLAAADILMLTGHARLNLSQHEQARSDLMEALQLLQSHRPDAFRDMWRINYLLTVAGRYMGTPDAALQHARAAEDLVGKFDATWQDRLHTKIELGNVLLGNDTAAAESIFRDVLQEVPTGHEDAPLLKLSALASLTVALTLEGQFGEEQIAIAEERISLAREVHGSESSYYAYTLGEAVNIFTHHEGLFDRAGQLAHEAVAVTSRIHDGHHGDKTSPLCNLAYYLLSAGQTEEALGYFDATLENVTALGEQHMGAASCQQGRALARAKLGDYMGALEDLKGAGLVLANLNQLDSPLGLDRCGYEASMHLRLGDQSRSQRALEACRTPTAPGESVPWSLARAELHLAAGENAEAIALVEEARRQSAPERTRRGWMRPWMLSVLLARTTGDEAAEAMLVNELGEFSSTPPLEGCLAKPDTVNCLALP